MPSMTQLSESMIIALLYWDAGDGAFVLVFVK
jgi:hypothetical protein